MDKRTNHQFEQPEVIAHYAQLRQTGKKGYTLTASIGQPARITHKDIKAYWKPKFDYYYRVENMMTLLHRRVLHLIWLRCYLHIEIQTIKPYDAIAHFDKRVSFERKEAQFVLFRWLTIVFKAH
ncbi:hypothetical protein [Shewanella cutis]|uniref:Uncharacterized protein n=1 Tax=Shewanella cutis TaxID=2766780 RepID=A0ABS9QYJ3_9GAMM|nr:hypothetical protein [Shewanella sp. PS-2]MCG9964598.1 hypothetical protein [Shewanella sp. PS-2]